MQRKCSVYRLYDEYGQLLYVGISFNPGHRFTQHEQTKAWWEEVAGISIEWKNSREEALAVERRAIHVEKPLHNIDRPRVRPMRSPRACNHCWACNMGEPCFMYTHPPAEVEDEIGRCGRCGRLDCMYTLGYSVGDQHGWTRAFDTLTGGGPF